MPSDVWGREVSESYDSASASMFEPAVLDPTVDLLFELARSGPVLEFAVGTGRVALPLSARGLAVSGIELSPHMAAQLRAKPGAERVSVTVGDMTTTQVPGKFRLVYLVWNTIMNVTTQDEQVAIFTNAAAHLASDGCFVVEVAVPRPQGPGEQPRVFAMEDDHLGVDTYDDPVGQIMRSHHWRTIGGQMIHHAAPYRYVWPSELELMGRVAGLRLTQRWGGWQKEALTAGSKNQIALFERAI